MSNIFIDLLAFGTIISSVLVITSKNPVIAVTFLIAVFMNAAGYLILLGVGFIGITYIILYVGAITVLFLFVIMMINIKLTDILETGSQYTKNLPLALTVGALYLFIMYTIMPFTFNNVNTLNNVLDFFTNLNSLLLSASASAGSATEIISSSALAVNTALNPVIADTAISNFIQIQAIGFNLYSYGAILLIICSMLLLLAMVAPIFISRSRGQLSNPLRFMHSQTATCSTHYPVKRSRSTNTNASGPLAPRHAPPLMRSPYGASRRSVSKISPPSLLGVIRRRRLVNIKSLKQ